MFKHWVDTIKREFLTCLYIYWTRFTPELVRSLLPLSFVKLWTMLSFTPCSCHKPESCGWIRQCSLSSRFCYLDYYWCYRSCVNDGACADVALVETIWYLCVYSYYTWRCYIYCSSISVYCKDVDIFAPDPSSMPLPLLHEADLDFPSNEIRQMDDTDGDETSRLMSNRF